MGVLCTYKSGNFLLCWIVRGSLKLDFLLGFVGGQIVGSAFATMELARRRRGVVAPLRGAWISSEPYLIGFEDEMLLSAMAAAAAHSATRRRRLWRQLPKSPGAAAARVAPTHYKQAYQKFIQKFKVVLWLWHNASKLKEHINKYFRLHIRLFFH